MPTPTPAPAHPGSLDAVVKAYDVRGVVGDQLDESVARALGAALADLLVASAEAGKESTALLTGHDMRDSGPRLPSARRQSTNSTASPSIWPTAHG